MEILCFIVAIIAAILAANFGAAYAKRRAKRMTDQQLREEIEDSEGYGGASFYEAELASRASSILARAK